jgi:hypothetical protein
MTLEELNTTFLTGEIDFIDKSFFVQDIEFIFPYDSTLSLNLKRLIKEGIDCITYINREVGHLNFEYTYVKGSIVPNRVYIKTSAELKDEAAQWFNNWKNGDKITESAKIVKFSEFLNS